MREGYLPCRLYISNSLTQASLAYGERASCLLCTRTSLCLVPSLPTSQAPVLVGVAAVGTPSWDLEIKAYRKAIPHDNPSLLVLFVSACGAVPQFCAIAVGKWVVVAAEASDADSPTCGCAILKILLLPCRLASISAMMIQQGLLVLLVWGL